MGRLKLNLEKLGLTKTEAAAFVGTTIHTFVQMVGGGEMPLARRIGKAERWSRLEVEAAFAALPSEDPPRDPYDNVG